jgi:hypothetical protein
MEGLGAKGERGGSQVSHALPSVKSKPDSNIRFTR